MTRSLSESERLDWLRLIRTENVGPVTFKQLLRRYGSAAKALEALPELAKRGGRSRGVKSPAVKDCRAELARILDFGAEIIAACEPDYPALLREIEDAPPLLIVKGHKTLFKRPTVAIVGSRSASINGQRLAETIAGDLARAGWLVVSGLARGIDGAAHRGAMAFDGATAAAIAGGIDVVYPPEHSGLQAEIGERGVLLTEMPPGTEPTARHFPRRNRLISGLSLGVVVIEANERSGSLITARMAGEQGREVMAVPGSPLDKRAKGGNALLKEGARLVEDAADILEALHRQRPLDLAETGHGLLGGEGLVSPEPSPAELDHARDSLIELLDPHPVAVDEILRRCQFSAPVVATVLLELELAGRVERHAGNRVSLIAL